MEKEEYKITRGMTNSPARQPYVWLTLGAKGQVAVAQLRFSMDLRNLFLILFFSAGCNACQY